MMARLVRWLLKRTIFDTISSIAVQLMQIRSQYARAEEEKAAVAEEVQKSDDTIQAVKAQIGEV